MTRERIKQYRSLEAELKLTTSAVDRERILAEINEIVAFVQGIDDSFARRVITLRYIEPHRGGGKPMKWEEVARRVRASISYCKAACGRYL